MVHITNKEYWAGFLKNIALVLYCSPEIHFTTRLLLLLIRKIKQDLLNKQVKRPRLTR